MSLQQQGVQWSWSSHLRASKYSLDTASSTIGADFGLLRKSVEDYLQSGQNNKGLTTKDNQGPVPAPMDVGAVDGKGGGKWKKGKNSYKGKAGKTMAKTKERRVWKESTMAKNDQQDQSDQSTSMARTATGMVASKLNADSMRRTRTRAKVARPVEQWKVLQAQTVELVRRVPVQDSTTPVVAVVEWKQKIGVRRLYGECYDIEEEKGEESSEESSWEVWKTASKKFKTEKMKTVRMTSEVRKVPRRNHTNAKPRHRDGVMLRTPVRKRGGRRSGENQCLRWNWWNHRQARWVIM